MVEATVHAVLIVGTGFSGLGAAIRLQQEGVHDVVLLEKADGIGGTWRHNTYPGCACDVPSHLYSFSFAPNADWSRRYAPQAEILAYLEATAERFGLGPKIRLNTEMTAAHWNDAERLWEVEAGDQRFRARSLVLGLGPLHVPRLPELPGQDRFRGPAFHTAQWRHDVDLRGKRVAVVGTGASAIQVVPALASQVERLHLFQRTPAWVLPRHDGDVPGWKRSLYRGLPASLALRRSLIYWGLESRAIRMTRAPVVLKRYGELVTQQLEAQVPDAELRARLTPDYTLGCKRILLSDDFYEAVQHPAVELLPEAVASLDETGVVSASGERREVDAVVWATGFHVTDALPDLPVTGRDGLRLQEAWSGGPEAYKGLAVAGFPNLSLMLGPNTGLGHNSMVFMIEAQIEQLLRTVELVESGRARTVEVRAEAQRSFNERLQARMGRTVWMSGCKSWYLDEDGKNRTSWPDFTWRFWLESKTLDEGDYRLER